MPVFGKGRSRRTREEFLEQEVTRISNSAPRQYLSQIGWTHEQTSLLKVEQYLVFPIRRFVSARFRRLKRPIVVLDWGCGTGESIRALQKGSGKKIRTYGFAKESHQEWTNDPNTKYIHSTAEDLLRYVRKNSVDLIYSHLGMSHLPTYSNMLPSFEHLRLLAERLTVGGMLVWNPGAVITRTTAQELENFLGKEWKLEIKKSPKPGVGLVFQITRLN
jgi:trans-aconitate methyltransferase